MPPPYYIIKRMRSLGIYISASYPQQLVDAVYGVNMQMAWISPDCLKSIGRVRKTLHVRHMVMPVLLQDMAARKYNTRNT